MRRKRFSPEQIIKIVKEAELGTTIKPVFPILNPTAPFSKPQVSLMKTSSEGHAFGFFPWHFEATLLWQKSV